MRDDFTLQHPLSLSWRKHKMITVHLAELPINEIESYIVLSRSISIPHYDMISLIKAAQSSGQLNFSAQTQFTMQLPMSSVLSLSLSGPWEMWQKCDRHLRGSFCLCVSQWEMTLHCNVISHWLNTCTERFLHLKIWFSSICFITGTENAFRCILQRLIDKLTSEHVMIWCHKSDFMSTQIYVSVTGCH